MYLKYGKYVVWKTVIKHRIKRCFDSFVWTKVEKILRNTKRLSNSMRA